MLTAARAKPASTKPASTKLASNKPLRAERAGASSPESAGGGVDLHRNEIVLVGRLSAVDPGRELPSGDELLPFRVMVRRSTGRRPGASVDVIDCHAVTGKVRRAVLAVPVGSTVEITGALRRRFFRAGGVLASRYDVEATSVRRARP